LLARLQTDLTQAVMRGDNPKVLAAGIAQKFGVAKHKAERLVLTETAYFNAQGQKDAYKEMDVEAVVFVATLDGRTSDVCRSMDGQIIAMKDYEPGVTVPPLHPFCRSTTAPWFDNDFTEVEFRASRDAAGKTVYEVPADMTYPEWEEKFVVGKKAPPDSSTDAGVAMDLAMTLKLEERDDLQALDKELVDKNVAQVKNLHAIYFGERQTAETFSIDSKTSAGNLAEYAPARHSAKPSEGNVRIGLNKAYYLDRKALIEKELMLRDSGFSMPFSDEKADVYSIAHEFGHHVADVLIKDRRDWKSFDQVMQKASMDKNISRARKRIQSFVDNEQKALNSEIYAIAKQSNSGILIREQLSRYGRTKPSEAFAEMFANANCGRPNALGSALLKFMESR
jgi:SPP1 gp7 family putative phage head morphogenesis protein